jgi:filamentous hemagglutinin family protein
VVGTPLIGTISQAQIVRDGTMGPAGALTGPDFTIPHTDGTLTGNNLFHSFSQFNINTSESATFTGPANVNNVLSRVTGGYSSTIDGLLRTSGMPNSNFFLINPAGVMFGPDAQLDVPAAFVVTTANVIELDDGGLFAATINPLDTVLTTAPPSAFGFLDDNPASIQVDQSNLEVGQNQAISLVGGDLQIQGDIAAPSGRVSLMSVSSSGTVTYDASTQTANLDVGAFEALGELEISNGAEINVAGNPGGTVLIRGGRFVLEGSGMTAQTQGDTDHPGTGFDIHITGDMILTGTPDGAAEIASSSASGANGNAGNTQIVANTLEITGEPTSGFSTNIGSRSFGAGDAGDVDITTERLTLNELCFISAPALSSGNGGDITIDSDTVELLGDNGWCYISTLSQGGGAAGNIDLTADTLLVRGGSGGFVGLTTQTNQFGTGAPGQMQITANDVQLLNGAQLSASLFNGEAIGGNIEVTADTILISGRNPYGYSAGIFSSASEWNPVNPLVTMGKGGSIQISADTLTIDNGGLLGAWTEGRGEAGEIEIDAQDINIFNWSGIRNNAWFAAGDAGDIHINTDTLNV